MTISAAAPPAALRCPGDGTMDARARDDTGASGATGVVAAVIRGVTVNEAGPPAPTVLDLRRTADLESAYRLHAAELHRFAARRLRDEAAAADVVQETFVRAWRHASRYDAGVASLRVWLFTIARHVVVDQVRRERARPGLPTDPGILPDVAERGRRSGAGHDAGFSDDLVTAWFVEEALGRLGHDQRTAIVETAMRGRSYAEVAAELDVPVGTLRSRVFYGLRTLRTIMNDMGAPL